MQTHTSNGNEGKRPIPDHGLAVSDHVAAVPDHIEAVKTAGPATAGRGMPLTATENSKSASGHDAFEPSKTQGGTLDTEYTSPLRVSFTVQHTDFGMERLYGELAALKTDVERMRHVKRCLLDIVRGDFYRAPLALPELGDVDRESFKLHARLSTRDTGLESLYQELKPLLTVFKRNTYLRRRLYDASRPTAHSQPNHRCPCLRWPQVWPLPTSHRIRLPRCWCGRRRKPVPPTGTKRSANTTDPCFSTADLKKKDFPNA